MCQRKFASGKIPIMVSVDTERLKYLFARAVNIEILWLNSTSEMLVRHAGLDAVMLVQEVVAVVALTAAPSVVKHVAVADVWVVVEPAQP